MVAACFGRFTSRMCLLAGLVTALPAAAAPPQGAAPLHEWLFGRGRMGIRVQDLTPELREYFGAPQDRGVLVSEVESGRPAARAGLRVGDVIVAVGDQPVESPGQLAGVVRRAPQGGSLSLQVIRKGETLRLEIQPDDPATPLVDREMEEWMERFGRHLEEGGRQIERRLEELERRIEELQRSFDERFRELENEQGQET